MRDFKVMKFGTVGAAVVAAVLSFGAASPASAAFKISLDDGMGSSVVISDNGVGDLAGGTAGIGKIIFSDTVGTWSTNVVVGLSKPKLGPFGSLIDLLSVNISEGVGTLTLTITDTDFDFGPSADLTLISNVGGTAGGTFNFNTYFDSSNTEFGMPAPALATLGPLGPGAFSGSAAGHVMTSALNGGLFSLTAEAVINHAGPETTSFDGEIRIPEPATLGMLGFGLIALGAFLRRRNGSQR